MFVTATTRLPGFNIGQEHFELHSLEPVYMPNNYLQTVQNMPFIQHLVIEDKPDVYKKRYYKGCLKQDSKVLVARYGGIGDIQWVIPCIRAIKEKYPKIQIKFACFEKDREMFINCNLIDSIINTKYPTVQDVMWCDYYIDYFDTVEGIGENEAKLRSPIDINLDMLGLEPSSYLGYYEITEQERLYAISILGAKKEIRLALPLVASSPHRSWNNQDELIKLLAKDNIKCVLLSDATPHAEGIIHRIKSQGLEVIDLTKQTTLRQMVAICNECDLTMCNDTGIVNIMATLGKKVLSIYSTVPAETRSAHYPTVNTLQVEKGCSPCYKLGATCKYGSTCLNTISAKTVYKKIKILLKEV